MKDQPNIQLQTECISSPWKAIGRILIALPFTLLLLPIQTAVLALNLRSASWLPRFFHRQWCRIFGIDVRVSGWISTERPVLFVANHVSYLDFIVLSSVLEATFVAKAEIAGWPILGILARSLFFQLDSVKSVQFFDSDHHVFRLPLIFLYLDEGFY